MGKLIPKISSFGDCGSHKPTLLSQ